MLRLSSICHTYVQAPTRTNMHMHTQRKSKTSKGDSFGCFGEATIRQDYRPLGWGSED